ncbi:MAG: hypothetical protein EA340_10705 [Nitriliruptor sp.]|nr:MAG: hypothetical protein EA340_10705 [Nitriliruptor sp.]
MPGAEVVVCRSVRGLLAHRGRTCPPGGARATPGGRAAGGLRSACSTPPAAPTPPAPPAAPTPPAPPAAPPRPGRIRHTGHRDRPQCSPRAIEDPCRTPARRRHA